MLALTNFNSAVFAGLLQDCDLNFAWTCKLTTMGLNASAYVNPEFSNTVIMMILEGDMK